MLDGDEVAESTFIDCPECVDISLLNFDINGTGTLAFFAEDCDGNASILKQVVITAAYDEDPPVVTWVSPTDGETIIGTSHIFEVSVTSDNDDLEVCLTIDGFDRGCDSSSPYKWLISGLSHGYHTAIATATDGCGLQGSAEITFPNDPYCPDVDAPLVLITEPGDIECMPHDIFAEVTDNVGVVDVWMEIDGWVGTINGMPAGGDTYKFHVTDGLENGPNLITVYAEDACENTGEDAMAVNFICPNANVIIVTPTENELLCGMYTFTATTSFGRELPEVECVGFYFDGAQSPTYIDCDDSDGWNYTVDVNIALEPGGHQITARAESVDMDGNVDWVWSNTRNFVKTCDPIAVLELDGVYPCENLVCFTAEYSSDDNSEPPLTYEIECITCPCESIIQSSPSDPTFCIVNGDDCHYGDHAYRLTVTDGWDLTDEVDLVIPIDDICTDTIAITFPDPADPCPVYGDFEDSWALIATATDRDLTDPYIASVDFYYDDTSIFVDGPWVCQDTDGNEDVWSCDWPSENLPAAGGWYYAHAISTDWADNELWAAGVDFYKSDMPVIEYLLEEAEDGDIYIESLGVHNLEVTWSDDNTIIVGSTYWFSWDLSCDEVVDQDGEEDTTFSWDFTEIGTYSLCLWIVETTPCGATVASSRKTWAIHVND